MSKESFLTLGLLNRNRYAFMAIINFSSSPRCVKYLPALVILVSMLGFGQQIERVTLNSPTLNQERELWIYTPREFKEHPERKFETFYVFDSQNRAFFDLVHSSIEFLSPEGDNFLVVGIISPYSADQPWSRNMEMLPGADHQKTIDYYGGHLGRADDFLIFLEKDVIPHIENTYRALPKKNAVGHSNSATLILYSLLVNPGFFDDYIAVSPNLAFDNEQMVSRFENFNLDNIEHRKFLYLSSANESKITGWEGWDLAREKVYNIMQHWDANKIKVEIQSFPEENHWSTYPFGLIGGMAKYFDYARTRAGGQ